MNIKKITELKLRRPPTDITVRQNILYASTKGKRLFFMPEDAKEFKSILFSSQVNAISASNGVIYCGCADGRVFGLNEAHKVVLRSSSDASGVTQCRYDSYRGNILLSTFNKKVLVLGENSILQNTFYCHSSAIADFDISRDGTICCASQNNKMLKLIDLSTKASCDLHVTEGFPESVVLLSDDSLVVGTLAGGIQHYARSKDSSFGLRATYSSGSAVHSLFAFDKSTVLVGLADHAILLLKIARDEIVCIDKHMATGIPIAFCRYKEHIAVATSREPRLGRWGKSKTGRNAVTVIKIES